MQVDLNLCDAKFHPPHHKGWQYRYVKSIYICFGSTITVMEDNTAIILLASVITMKNFICFIRVDPDTNVGECSK